MGAAAGRDTKVRRSSRSARRDCELGAGKALHHRAQVLHRKDLSGEAERAEHWIGESLQLSLLQQANERRWNRVPDRDPFLLDPRGQLRRKGREAIGYDRHHGSAVECTVDVEHREVEVVRCVVRQHVRGDDAEARDPPLDEGEAAGSCSRAPSSAVPSQVGSGPLPCVTATVGIQSPRCAPIPSGSTAHRSRLGPARCRVHTLGAPRARASPPGRTPRPCARCARAGGSRAQSHRTREDHAPRRTRTSRPRR